MQSYVGQDTSPPAPRGLHDRLWLFNDGRDTRPAVHFDREEGAVIDATRV